MAEIGEVARDVLLRLAQDVDGKSFGLLENRIDMRFFVEAEQHEGRFQRHRGEGVDGDAGRPALGMPRGDHGHARGEAAHHLTEGEGIGHDSLWLKYSDYSNKSECVPNR